MKKIVVSLLIAAFASFAHGAQNYVSDEGRIVYTNSTGSTIGSGNIVDLGDRYGVALGEITNTGSGVVQTEGIWAFIRAVTNSIANGVSVYRASVTSVTDVATADTYIGQTTEYAATVTNLAERYIYVDINAPQRQVIVGTDVQAYDADLASLSSNNGASLTNIPATALRAGTIAPAIDGSSITNIAGALIKPTAVNNTNTIAVAVTNIAIGVANGRITSLTVNGTTW